MTNKEYTRFLLWCGEKLLAGHSLTEQELDLFKEARQATLPLACKIMRLKPEDYRYEKGVPFRPR